MDTECARQSDRHGPGTGQHMSGAIGERYREVRNRLAEWRKKNITEGLAGDKNVELLGARGATAVFIGDTVRNSTESIITATRVFKDNESSPQEQAAAVLRVFSSFSMMAALSGPEGLIAGSIVSALLGMVTMILDATAPDRMSELAKFEQLLRSLRAKDAADEVNASQRMLNRDLATVKSFPDGSKSWDGDNSILLTAPITSDPAHFHLAKTSEWLKDPENKNVEQWEEVFLAYAATITQDLYLLSTMLEKLRSDLEVRRPMLAFMQKYGADMEKDFEDLMDTVEDCGDYWHTSWGNQSGLYTRNPWQPRRAYDGWGDMNIGHAQSISISPRNGRIWIDDEDSPDHPLRTGMPPRFGVFDLDSHAAKGCIDVCLVPWADTDTDLLLLTVTQPINSRPRLIINEWKERRSEFFKR
jgi:hypothetical protein